MALSAQVQALVDQVTASKSIEAASALAWTGMVNQLTDLKAQLAAAVAAAGAAGMSAEDTVAITKAVTDLHDSATVLQTAVPANTTPTTPIHGA